MKKLNKTKELKEIRDMKDLKERKYFLELLKNGVDIHKAVINYEKYLKLFK